MFIYKTTNKVNGKMYIGMCTRNDPNYFGSGKLILEAIKKYGKENFTRETIEECEDFDTLCEREVYWIGYYDAVSSDKFYNLSYGGSGGDPELMKEYWDSLTKEERKSARNWKPHFLGLDQSGQNHISKKDESWSTKVAEGVKRSWDSYTPEERESRGKKTSESRIKLGTAKGSKNPMYGRSAVTEQNLKWYTNGVDNLYVTEGTQPANYRRGRTVKKRR